MNDINSITPRDSAFSLFLDEFEIETVKETRIKARINL